MNKTVIKFGGTSVGSVSRMNDVIALLRHQPGSKVIVLSAMAGTTNRLTEIASYMSDQPAKAAEMTSELYGIYQTVVEDLYHGQAVRDEAMAMTDVHFGRLRHLLGLPWTLNVEKEIQSIGELLSTQLFCFKCKEAGIRASVLPALDFMKIDGEAEPDLDHIRNKLVPLLQKYDADEWVITQGYICLNDAGEVDNLKRGGSDYTATIIGAVIEAVEIQIWTDIDGIHNNDPRIVERTEPIRVLSYREAAELAYFGAKILHPTCVLPAERAQVPLRLKYTMEPDKPGTLIGTHTSKRPITAIAAKDGITAIKIYSHRMLMAYGFLKKIFQVFEDHRTPIDMITTSEVAVSVTVDQNDALDQITAELGRFAEVETAGGYTIICIVGNALYDQPTNISKIFGRLEGIPIRMVSMGGSRYNLSVLLPTRYKVQALQSLNHLFDFDKAP